MISWSKCTNGVVVMCSSVSHLSRGEAAEWWREDGANRTPLCTFHAREQGMGREPVSPPSTKIKITIPGATVECEDEAALRRLATFLTPFAEPDVTQHGFGCECDACDACDNGHYSSLYDDNEAEVANALVEPAKAAPAPLKAGDPVTVCFSGGPICQVEAIEDRAYVGGFKARRFEHRSWRALNPVLEGVTWLRGHISDEEARRAFGLAKAAMSITPATPEALPPIPSGWALLPKPVDVGPNEIEWICNVRDDDDHHAMAILVGTGPGHAGEGACLECWRAGLAK